MRLLAHAASERSGTLASRLRRRVLLAERVPEAVSAPNPRAAHHPAPHMLAGCIHRAGERRRPIVDTPMPFRVSRRQLLQALAGTSLRLPAPLALAPACSSSNAATDDLDALLPGRVLRPGAAEYDRYTKPWNLRWVPDRPVAAAVVRAASADDVATALGWAQRTGTPLVARSGGHSYAGYSTTPGLIIDVSSMTRVTFDAATGRATVGGGARNRDAYNELTKVKHSITHGRCYEVGVAGLVLGGGIGFNMRRFGLTCDQLLETDVVLASGERLRCNEKENADLFWAARGAGGGNFGIHTSFTFQTYPVDDIVAFDITFEEKLDDLLVAILREARSAPRELGLKVTARVKSTEGQNRVVVNLLGQWAGAAAGFDAWLAPLLALATPAMSMVRTLPYWDGQALLSEEGEPEFGYERSRYAHGELGADFVAFVLERLRAWPGTSAAASWKLFLTGGAVSDIAPTATAFVHRKDWALTTIDLNWNEGDDPARVLTAFDWVDAFYNALTTYTSGETYQNFIDADETNWRQAYYGENLPRLVEVKRRYDPTNVFAYAQSIPTQL